MERAADAAPKRIMLHRVAIILILLLAGCSRSGEKSDLLSLLGIDEKIADTSDQETGKVYDGLTLLKRGEAQYVKEDYAAAAEEYQRFLELHPFHRMAAFAQYRLGMSYYHQLNTNDRDPGPMEKAIGAFDKVVQNYPQSLYRQEASEKLTELNRRLAQHDFYVGYFYYKNNAYPAAIARFQKVLAKGEDPSLVEKSLYYKGLSHYYNQQADEAKETFQRLLRDYPDTPFSGKATQILSQVDSAPRLSSAP